jgi:hypothetical protein
MNTNGPVDIVYLWVDGSDAAWRSKRRAAQQQLDGHQRQQIAAHGDVEGRFRDNEELRYSLRALDRFFRTTAMSTSSPMGRCRPGCTRIRSSASWTIAT